MTGKEPPRTASRDSTLSVHHSPSDLTFSYGEGVFGPQPELRRLDSIRRSLHDPHCDGPDPVYSIVMDVGREEHREELQRRMLLFGVVAFARGRLGKEPVHGQGHVHAVAPHCGWSTPELFEIWEGEAIIFAQERVDADPGHCIAISACPGEKVVVPPGWGHYVVNADPAHVLVLGAWCDRQYSFIYEEVRARGGLAWFPVLNLDLSIRWEPNPSYNRSELARRNARGYPELGLNDHTPIYEQFSSDADGLQWVSDPGRMEHLWLHFEP